jgi:hypothetical protein
MGVVVLAHVDLNDLDAPVEPAGSRVVVADRHAVVVADIGRLVGGEDQRLGEIHAAGSGAFAVVVERHVAALGEAAAVLGELHAHLVLALGRASDASVSKYCMPSTL